MEGRGVCYNPDQIWEECHDEWWEDGSVKGCKYSQEDCSTRRPGFKFRPYFHAEKALNIGFEYTRTAHRCCEDQKVSEGCKNGDSYLQEPPTIDSFQICHDMSKFRPTVILENDEKGPFRCEDVIPHLLQQHVFSKGLCSGGVCDGGQGCRVRHTIKTACEYFGGTFTPFTQSMVEADSYGWPRPSLSECCGGIDNVKNTITLTQYVKDGFVDTIPAPQNVTVANEATQSNQGDSDDGSSNSEPGVNQIVKNAVKYHTCANPWTYNVSKDHCSEDWMQSCRHQMEGRGVCYNPDQIWEECHDEWWEDGSVKGCKYSQEDCSTRRPGFKFRPYFHAEKALNIGFEYTRTAHRCCEDQKVSEGCKNGDSYLQEPPTIDSFQICHDMSKFRPTVILEEDEEGTYTCEDAIPHMLHGHLFYKGECSPHPDGCRVCSASKTACEYFGGTFTPLTQSKLETDSYYQKARVNECCGGIDNVKNPYTLTQYVKDGFVDTIPAPGVCVRDSCCGEGTVWEDGYGCTPTKSGMVDACKAARGKWGWTCEAETGCSA